MKGSRERYWFITVVITVLADVASIGGIRAQVPSGEAGNRTEEGRGLVRERRFVRFPSGPAGAIYDGPGPTGRNLGFSGGARFAQPVQYPSWRQQKSSFWRSPGPANDYPRPVMSHRTPRLIFRDDFPSLPSSGPGASFFQSNQLPDIDEDYRGKTSKYTWAPI